MHVLAIDVGSYSVKYISSFVEKRRISHVQMGEVLISEHFERHPQASVYEVVQASIIEDLISTIARPDTRVIYQADNGLMTTRFLTLPVKSKKKAEQMLPFQLEEDIPFAISEVHYAYRLEPAKTQYFALVGLIRETAFEAYYSIFRDKNVLPNILTTEASAVENYFNISALAGPFCVLDIGHRTTKAYFFYNSRLIVTNVSYFGGQDINEMISNNYRINKDEAIIYKHQNAFLLTGTQMGDVDEAQREFAQAMDRVFSTLVSDFNRWKIGFKVNFGLSLAHVYITGGTSNIKNIANYLSDKFDTKVVLLETFDKVDADKVDLDAGKKSKFALTNMMAIGMRKKNRFLNLLSGRFAQASLTEIPLHSFAFIGIRVAAVTAVLALSLIAERFFIERDIKTINSKMTSLIKTDVLGLNARLRRSALTNPKQVYDALVKKQRGVKDEINTLQAAIETQALSPLAALSLAAASAQGSTLTEFTSSDAGDLKATFTADSADELNNLKAILERSTLSDVVVTVDTDKLVLTLSASI